MKDEVLKMFLIFRMISILFLVFNRIFHVNGASM